MKANLFGPGTALLLLVTVGLASTAKVRLQAHGHQHGDVYGRIMHKPTASSGSSFLVTAIQGPLAPLPKSARPSIGVGCFDGECARLNATNPSRVSTRVTPMPQPQNQHLELRDDGTALPFSRRPRYRTRSVPKNGDFTATIKVDSLTSEELMMKPTANTLLPHNALPTSIDVEVDGVLENVSIDDVEPHVFPGFEARDPHHPLHPIVPRQDNGYQSFVLGGFSSPTSSIVGSVAVASVTAYGYTMAPAPSASTSVTLSVTSASTALSAAASSTASASSICPASNGTTYTSADGIEYQIDCNTDFLENNLDYQLVGSFAGCVQKCDAWNYNHHQVQCLAALFLPDREVDANDCYLKSNLVDPSSASLLIEGAIRMGYATVTSAIPTLSSTSVSQASAAAVSTSTSTAHSVAESSTSSSIAPTSSASSISSPGVTYGSGSSVIVPKVGSSHLQGPTQNTPSQQYIDVEGPAGITLASSLLTVGVNGDLTTGYEISEQTGVLEVNISTQSHLSPLKNTPHLSRDGGRGGMVNGEHVFVFCDTGSYSTTTSTSNGNFLGFVSSSVATDVGMKGLTGGPLNLQDGIGQWSDDAGRMRGFAPLTEGEVAYNQVMQGQGQRYAVWPESDIIPLDATTGIMYAPIVYDNVNEITKAAVFTYTGATLLTISAGGNGGPVAERTVEKIFQQDEIEWGCSGGIRSWGVSGIGGDDGKVYIFGNVAGGILLGRTSPAKITDVTSIQYWDGSSWTNNMPTSTSKAYFIAGSFMDVNVFYSPRHLTFIIVYLTIYADSTFYYRYLEADQGILPPFAPGGDSSSDYVETILKYNWSEQQVLYKAAQGLSGKYIYSGGPHLGYYGSNDIINGGSRMLLSWAAPTGLDPSTLTSEYQILTAEIDWV